MRFPEADHNKINSFLNRGITILEKTYMTSHYVPEIVTKIPVKSLTKKASYTNF